MLNLLIDTDYAGALTAFYQTMKNADIRVSDIQYSKINESAATIISCEESRKFLSSIGIFGEIIHTPSHSEDSISLILDNGSCLVGDLDPLEYLEAYENNIHICNTEC